jgi:hypothetical protein
LTGFVAVYYVPALAEGKWLDKEVERYLATSRLPLTRHKKNIIKKPEIQG